MSAEGQYIEELRKERDHYKASLLGMMQVVSGRQCPFCYGKGLVSDAKAQVRQGLIQQWHEPLTWEEIESDYKRKEEEKKKAKAASNQCEASTASGVLREWNGVTLSEASKFSMADKRLNQAQGEDVGGHGV